jgi:uncharacterized protein (DUF1330 family)
MTNRYYQVVLISLKDVSTFQRYGELLAPIVTRYGGARERLIRPDAVFGEGVAKPDLVNVVYYDSREAFTAFTKDPAFREIVHLRSQSIDMIAIDGPPAGGSVSDEGLASRTYLVEMARYGDGGAAAYHAYEAEAAALYERHGYHVERVLAVEAAAGLDFRPDVVKIAYFDQADGMQRMHADPGHAAVRVAHGPRRVRPEMRSAIDGLCRIASPHYSD